MAEASFVDLRFAGEENSVVQDENVCENYVGRLAFKDGDTPQVLTSPAGNVYELSRVIGQGAFGACFLATNSSNGQEVAMKIVPKTKLQKKAYLDKMKSEIAIQSKLDHPNIVSLYEDFQDEDNVYIAMSLCTNGTLGELREVRQRFTEPEIRFWGLQLAQALKYLHQEHLVIHRDLKLGNLLLDEDLNLLVGDFGLSGQVDSPKAQRPTFAGTANFMPPEIWQSKNGVRHSFEVDVWSFGVVLYLMATGRLPYQGQDQTATSNRILHDELRFPRSVDVSPQLESLIRACMKKDPTDRLSIDQVIGHPFFTDFEVPESIPLSALDSAPFPAYVRTSSTHHGSRTPPPPRPARGAVPLAGPRSAPSAGRFRTTIVSPEPENLDGMRGRYVPTLYEENTADVESANTTTPESRHTRVSSLAASMRKLTGFGSSRKSLN